MLHCWVYVQVSRASEPAGVPLPESAETDKPHACAEDRPACRGTDSGMEGDGVS